MNSPDPETPFIELHRFVDSFNQLHPDKSQPIDNVTLSLLNELKGVGMNTAWKDHFFDRWNNYNVEFDKLPDLSKASIKSIQINFGTSFETFEDELLINQIQTILKEHLTRKYVKTISKKRGPGQKRSTWLRICIQGKHFIEKLYAQGVTNDFLAHFFDVEPETFKRKIRTVFLKPV